MKHLDLFSGIGGFALATEMVWDDVEHVFCDIEPFSQRILAKHWPNSKIYGDIRWLNGQEIGKIDILTGGFPCQPFSAAGSRRGTEDNRHLWPEMLRVIRETHPSIVLGENVYGFTTWDGGVVLERVCTDLEAEGYEVFPFIIPACSLNAPHRRDRVWIIAHATSAGDNRGPSEIYQEKWGPQRELLAEHADTDNLWVSTNSASTGSEWGSAETRERVSSPEGRHTTWAEDERRDNWNNWPAAAAELCPVDDGLPGGLVRPRGWRADAFKGAGNAIVPQVAAQILQAIKSSSVYGRPSSLVDCA